MRKNLRNEVQRNDHINVLTDMETDLYIAAMVKDA